MKIAICTPYLDTLLPEVYRACLRLEARLLQHQFTHVELDMNVVSLARHNITLAVPPDTEALWWIDSDVILPDNAGELIDHLKDHMLVSGLYFSRRPPYLPQAYNLAGTVQGKHPYLPIVNIPTEPTLMDATGAGCLVMRRELVEIMQREHELYLQYLREAHLYIAQHVEFPQAEGGPIYQRILDVCMHYAQALGPWFEFLGGVGEDFYFCEQAQRYAGVRPLLVPSVVCGHNGRQTISAEHFRQMVAGGVVYTGLGGQ